MQLTQHISYFDKLPLLVLATCLLAGQLWFSAAALAADDRGLPDTLVFREGVELPDYATGRELPCRVTSDDGQTLTVDVSRYKGVVMAKTIDKALIAEVRAASDTKAALDAKSALQKIAAKLKLPEDSQPAGYYDAIVNDDLKPLAEKFPNSEISAPLAAARRALEHERMLVAAGWVRLGGMWFTPAEAREHEAQRELRALMADMKAALPEVRAGQGQRLIGLAGRVAQFKNSLYYPYLLDGAQTLARQASNGAAPHDLLALTTRQSSANLLELAVKFQKIRARITEIENLRQGAPGLYAPVLGDLDLVCKGWPELNGLRETAEQCANGVLRELWLAAARGDDRTGDAAQLPTRQLKVLTDSGMLSLSTARKIRVETEEALAFSRKLRALKKEHRQGEIAVLTLSTATADENAGAREALAAQVAAAEAAMKSAGDELAAARAAYDAGNFSDAAARLAAARQTCADHPEALALSDRATADFEQVLKKGRSKRQREQLAGLWQVLRAGGSPRTDEFAADLNRERDFFSSFDNFSAALTLSIALGVALVVVALKFIGKFFTDA